MNRKDIREDWYQYVEDNTDADNKLNFRTVINMFYFITDVLDNIENKTCGNCEHFKADDSIDPNNHFGFCYPEDEHVFSIASGNIITIDDGCVKDFKRKEK